jgi:hypothetical protein
MTPKERAAQKRETEREEALGHLAYFKEMGTAYEQAIKRMQENHRLCQKNIKLWEGRIERMEAKAKE